LNLKKLKWVSNKFMAILFMDFFDYKMVWKLLDSGSYVNEVGLKIGYSTGSHFIAAFKRNLLPHQKKYLMSINPKRN
jgi:methylphosphotriester-DNA--protein-cysteine methyltransferase